MGDSLEGASASFEQRENEIRERWKVIGEELKSVEDFLRAMGIDLNEPVSKSTTGKLEVFKDFGNVFPDRLEDLSKRALEGGHDFYRFREERVDDSISQMLTDRIGHVFGTAGMIVSYVIDNQDLLIEANKLDKRAIDAERAQDAFGQIISTCKEVYIRTLAPFSETEDLDVRRGETITIMSNIWDERFEKVLAKHGIEKPEELKRFESNNDSESSES